MYSGIAGSGGIAAGRAYVYKNEQALTDSGKAEPGTVEAELLSLEEGIRESRTQLEELKNKVSEELDMNKALIFDAHLMMLEDPELLETVREAIRNDGLKAAYAVQKAADYYISVFGQIEDNYMRERAADIKDVCGRLIRNILGVSSDGLRKLDSPVIIVTHDLTPSDTASMNKSCVLGFASDIGGGTSHAAIMAKSLGIPAVLGLGDISARVNNGDHIIIDGNEGKVLVNPEEELEMQYRKKIEEHKRQVEKYRESALLPAVTTDGRRLEIAGNIGTPRDIGSITKNGAEGVGLFRTEFLYMDRSSLPTEEEQLEAYRKAAEGLCGKPVIIRTLDIGGDKKLTYLDLPEELNPFLGWRAIRICLERKDIFRTQLRAILRASAYGNILIMFPMISGVGEVREAKAVLEEVKAELRNEKISFDETVKVGIMVEIPSAAVTADIIAKEVDFFSIGTNDLCQYSLAVDRMNPRVSKLYQPLHPGILRLIKNVIDASHKYGKFTGMCGEMAGSAEAAVILLGLGLDEYSMNAASIPVIKNILRKASYEKAREVAAHALELSTPEEVLEYSQAVLKQLDI
ncbi:MAG TPA: phosphoenolpyruvate--protein phosphotransferase [Clostridia bacterium]|nr:phosphoenolpyruvate--protein phosphotransferase [Clostridia bacterium]